VGTTDHDDDRRAVSVLCLALTRPLFVEQVAKADPRPPVPHLGRLPVGPLCLSLAGLRPDRRSPRSVHARMSPPRSPRKARSASASLPRCRANSRPSPYHLSTLPASIAARHSASTSSPPDRGGTIGPHYVAPGAAGNTSPLYAGGQPARPTARHHPRPLGREAVLPTLSATTTASAQSGVRPELEVIV